MDSGVYIENTPPWRWARDGSSSRIDGAKIRHTCGQPTIRSHNCGLEDKLKMIGAVLNYEDIPAPQKKKRKKKKEKQTNNTNNKEINL